MDSVLQEGIIFKLCSYFGVFEVRENIKFHFKHYALDFRECTKYIFHAM